MKTGQTNAALLRSALRMDAIGSLGAGLALTAGAGWVAEATALPRGLLYWSGLLFLAWGTVVEWLACRAQPPRGAVLTVIVLNLLFVFDCIALLATGLVAPNPLGVALLLGVANAALLFALLQAAGLRAHAGGAQHA
jgi:hypothetical protein